MQPHLIERRIVTVLFADLVGFTSLSERLDPEDVRTVQGMYFEHVREIVGRYGGVLEKFIGDAVMAVFGIPRARDDDPERAVRAGFALILGLEEIESRLGVEPGALRLRVGVNTGEVVYGARGSDEGQVTGDTVNVAARLQAAAAPGTVLVGEMTALAVEDAVELEAVGTVQVKGKAQMLRPRRASRLRPHPSRDFAMGSLRASFIGRAAEMAALTGALRRAAAGTAERLTIVAPPGVGKTRLVREFSIQATEWKPAAWHVRLRPESASLHHAMTQLMAGALMAAGEPAGTFTAGADALPGRLDTLRTALARAGIRPTRAEVIAGEIQMLLEPSPADEGTQASGSSNQEAAFGAWLEGLDSLAASATQLWIVEDLHWGGPDLLAFLDFAGRTAPAGGRLILATARPALLDQAPAWARAGEIGSGTLHLGPLATSDARVLIGELIGNALPEALVAEIAERSDGTPLFIEELLRMWISIGTLVPSADGPWALAAGADITSFPPTVQAIYAAQLDDLPQSARQLACRASVAGRRFPADALVSLGMDDLASGLEVLRERALITGPESDPVLGRMYSYRHALLRDAAIARLSRSERAALHLRMAEWLRHKSDGGAAQMAEPIATHYAEALAATPALGPQDIERVSRDEITHLAAEWFERAAVEALEAAGIEEGRKLLRRALAHTSADATLDRARRLQRLGAATAFAADMDEAGALLREAIDLYGHELGVTGLPVSDRAQIRAGFAGAVAVLGRVLYGQLRFQEALSLVEGALERLGPPEDTAAARLLLMRVLATEGVQTDTGHLISDVERALRIARAAGDRELELEALEWSLQHRTNGSTAGPPEWENLQGLAQQVGRWDKVLLALRTRATLLRPDHVAQTWAILDHGQELADARQLTEERGWVEYGRAESGFLSGEWDLATASGEKALEIGQSRGYHRVVVRTWHVLTAIALARGDVATLRRALDWYTTQYRFPNSPFARITYSAAHLRFAAMGLTGPFDVEVEPVLRAISLFSPLPSWLAGVEIVLDRWLESGRLDAVRLALPEVARWHEQGVVPELGKACEAFFHAKFLSAAGAPPGDVDPYGITALEGFRRCRAAWWTAKSIRALERMGTAASELVAEAESIERALRVLPPPSTTFRGSS